jgi:hypothetical protein
MQKLKMPTEPLLVASRCLQKKLAELVTAHLRKEPLQSRDNLPNGGGYLYHTVSVDFGNSAEKTFLRRQTHIRFLHFHAASLL